jgi:hypothetical protein
VEAAVKPDQMEGEDKILEHLNARLGEAAAVLLGDAKDVRVTEEWDVRVRGRVPSLASRAAQIRAGFACSIALAQLSGLKLLVLDDLDAVVGAPRAAVLKLCGKMAQDGTIDTAILCCAQADKKPGPQAPWLKWFHIDNGQAAAL